MNASVRTPGTRGAGAPRESIRERLEAMRLESIAADEMIRCSGPEGELDAVIAALREKAQRERQAGEVPSVLRLERRAWALGIFRDHGLDAGRLIRAVDIPAGYGGKILMVRISGTRIPEPGRVCLRSGDEWHHEIFRNTEAEVRDLGFETAVVTPAGGARVRFETGGHIVVHGGSDAYGACDKTLAARMIARAFSGHTVTVRE